MFSKIQKWDDSLAIRIPDVIALEAQLKNGSSVEIKVINGQIVLTPTPVSEWKLEELLAGINSDNLHHEMDTGNSVGSEAW